MAEDSGVGGGGLEPDSHSFVLKVWREEGSTRPTWRGHITHVATGHRHPLLHLDAIGLFVSGYIEQLGVVLPLLWRVRHWLSRPPR